MLPLAAALLLSVSIAGCVGGLTTTRTEGYALSDSALRQIRPGQSEDLVVAVLGSPQSKNTFGNNESAYYYVQTKVEETEFGLRTIKDRTVLAVYFDNNRRVKDKVLYGLEDGRIVDLESRRTPSFGQDRTFVESIISSLNF